MNLNSEVFVQTEIGGKVYKSVTKFPQGIEWFERVSNIGMKKEFAVYEDFVYGVKVSTDDLYKCKINVKLAEREKEGRCQKVSIGSFKVKEVDIEEKSKIIRVLGTDRKMKEGKINGANIAWEDMSGDFECANGLRSYQSDKAFCIKNGQVQSSPIGFLSETREMEFVKNLSNEKMAGLYGNKIYKYNENSGRWYLWYQEENDKQTIVDFAGYNKEVIAIVKENGNEVTTLLKTVKGNVLE